MAQAEPQPPRLDERFHFPGLQWPQPSRGTAARGSQWISDRQRRTLVGPRWERVSPGWIGDRRDLFSGAHLTRATTIARHGPRTTHPPLASSSTAAAQSSGTRCSGTYAVPEWQHTSSSVSGRVTGRLRSTTSSAACPSLAWPSRLPVHFDNLLSAGRSRTRCRTSRLQRRRGAGIVTSPPASRPSCGRWQVTNPTPPVLARGRV